MSCRELTFVFFFFGGAGGSEIRVVVCGRNVSFTKKEKKKTIVQVHVCKGEIFFKLNTIYIKV
jgi:hypothetical protein